MEKIIRHIENLLLRNDYVIIPGLGGFVLQRQSAQITPDGIIPPRQTVGFNVRMDSNDGLLATEVLRTENITFRSALALIETEVAEIKKKLQAGTKVQMGKLGILYLNAEKRMVYKSSDEMSILPHNFGLNTIHIARRSKKKETKKITFTLPASKSVFRYAASVLILISMLLFAPRTGDSYVPDFAGINNPFSFFEPVKDNNEIAEEKETKENELTQSTSSPEEYHIIVSCLSNKTAAERYCELLQAKHYDRARVLPSVRTNRVVIESFADKENAARYLNDLKKSDKKFKDAWLHRELILR